MRSSDVISRCLQRDADLSSVPFHQAGFYNVPYSPRVKLYEVIFNPGAHSTPAHSPVCSSVVLLPGDLFIINRHTWNMIWGFETSHESLGPITYTWVQGFRAPFMGSAWVPSGLRDCVTASRRHRPLSLYVRWICQKCCVSLKWDCANLFCDQSMTAS